MKITETPKTNKSLVLSTAAGAAIGCGTRYVIPTKQEFGSLFNKKTFDTFTSSANTGAKGAGRSILKYAGIGAAIAAGLNCIIKGLISKKEEDTNTKHSKYEALIYASPDACQAAWYNA